MTEKDFSMTLAGDQNRINRDYALMRLENVDPSDLPTEEELRELANDFHSAQRLLLGTVGKAEQRDECRVIMTFEKRYRKVITLAREQAASLSVNKPSTSSSVEFVAKLPKINIKPFDGTLENWVSFKQLFDSLIHKRDISNVEKLHYLLSSVEGVAYDLIKNYPLSNESYLNAYSTLSKYYDKKRQIAFHYYEKMVHCEPIKVKSGLELEKLSRTFSENLAVLNKYDLPDRNFMLFHMLWSKLDRQTREAFQLEYNADDIPDFDFLQAFIEKQVRALDNSILKPYITQQKVSNKSTKVSSSISALIVSPVACSFCSGDHTLDKCPKFVKLSVNDRYDFVKSKNLCLLCLSEGHQLKYCRSRFRCRVCKYSHHTLLHFNNAASRVPSPPNHQPDTCSEPTTSAQTNTVLTAVTANKNILFSTAQVLIKDALGNYQSARALLDCASGCNFISEPCAKRLGLTITQCKSSVSGIGHSVAEPQGVLSCELRSQRSADFKLSFEALVLPSICPDQPLQQLDCSRWSHIDKLPLADPGFACPGPIDLLLNAEVFASSLISGLRQGAAGQPKALNTAFGWIVMGACDIIPSNLGVIKDKNCLVVSQPSHNLSTESNLLTSVVSQPETNLLDTLLSNFSSLSKLQRVLAYIFRFRRNTQAKCSKDRVLGEIQPEELHNALMFLIKHVQCSVFANYFKFLSDGTPNLLPKGLRKLSLFIDDAGLLRVGGRIAQSEVQYSAKHPLLLPHDHRLTSMIIEDYHRRFMHPGARTLESLICQSFWILSAKHAIRKVVSRCISCFRASPRLANPPIMGNLPSYRVSQLKPFSSVVVDYGGPFSIALGRGRGLKTFKGYICVFVCTSTKAIHIELASELTTEAFIAVLRRFVARRGRCSHIISDQGRNFVGAANHLGELMKRAANSEVIKFSFSPPGSPHFNGLAEAGIKSVKTHLSRVVGLQRLTFEELYTILSQVEAMLNSRPLTPLSSDANDLAALTPAHFLTLEPLTLIPEEDLTSRSVSVMQRWKLIQKMHQDFWNRWKTEYIHTLQQKSKWDKTYPPIAVGTLVLIVNEQTSPLHWALGRITDVHPGADGVCRVVTVRTASGVYKRPIVKVCPLPILN